MKRQLFTSYFGKRVEGCCIAICLYIPSGWRQRHYSLLAPDVSLLNDHRRGLVSNDEYAIRYYALLDKRRLSPLKVFNELGDKSVLLCYEKPTAFCHRHLLISWFGRLRIGVTEI